MNDDAGTIALQCLLELSTGLINLEVETREGLPTESTFEHLFVVLEALDGSLAVMLRERRTAGPPVDN